VDLRQLGDPVEQRCAIGGGLREDPDHTHARAGPLRMRLELVDPRARLRAGGSRDSTPVGPRGGGTAYEERVEAESIAQQAPTRAGRRMPRGSSDRVGCRAPRARTRMNALEGR